MTKYVDTFYRLANRAYMYDKGNYYDGEQLMLALLLHAKGTSRTMDDEKYIGRLLDDPNQKGETHGSRRGKQNPKPRPSHLPETYRWKVVTRPSFVNSSEVAYNLVIEHYSTKFFVTKWRPVAKRYLGVDLHTKWDEFDGDWTLNNATAMYNNVLSSKQPNEYGFVV